MSVASLVFEAVVVYISYQLLESMVTRIQLFFAIKFWVLAVMRWLVI